MNRYWKSVGCVVRLREALPNTGRPDCSAIAAPLMGRARRATPDQLHFQSSSLWVG